MTTASDLSRVAAIIGVDESDEMGHVPRQIIDAASRGGGG